MKYNFDKQVNRLGTNSVKYKCGEGVLPMWVADMDFETAPEVIEAIKERADHGVFGYTMIGDEWRNAYCYWWKTRYNYVIEPEWLLFCSGVVPVVTNAIRLFAAPGENVAILSPNYNHFYISIESCGCNALESVMIYGENGYSIDWEDLEEKISRSKAFILCNPHNPTGRIWSEEELKRIGDICTKHEVIVIADEIHCDITTPGKRYIPFASVSDAKCITGVAPSKTFNIAGLHTSAAIVKDKEIRESLDKLLWDNEVASCNCFALTGAVAAYTKGAQWVDEMCEYVYENKLAVIEYFKEHLPKLSVCPSDATYLLWVNVSAYTEDSSAFAQMIKEKSGLWVSDGMQYRGDGKHFLRVNVACPRATVMEGLRRLEKALTE